MNTGEKLRFFAKNNFPSLKAFSEALGIKQPDLSAYINGEVKPGYKLLIKLLALGCDINWLLSDDESPSGEEARNKDDPETTALRHKVDELEEENRSLRESLGPLLNQLQKNLALKAQKKGFKR